MLPVEKGRELQVHLGAEPRKGMLESSTVHEEWTRERERLVMEADIASANARAAREQFDERSGARLAKATELARGGCSAEAALVRRAEGLDTARRLHRDLVTLVEQRQRASDEREARRHDRRIDDVATTLARGAEHRMALDPVARRFAQYVQARSARALLPERSRDMDPPERSR